MYKVILNGKTREKNLKDCSCLLPISIGQNSHEGKKLNATIKLVNATFGSCLIVVANTPFWNITSCVLGETNENIQQPVRNTDLQWRKRNAEALKLLTIPSKIVSKDFYLESDKFTEKRKLIDDLSVNDENFKKALENTARKSLKQYAKDNSKISYNIGGLQNAF